MHLGDEAHPVVGQPFDDPHLPQGFGPVELAPGDITGNIGQFAEAAGFGDGGQPDVVVDVETGVVDPHRVAPPEGDLHQAALEHRRQGEALGNELLHPGERVAPRDGRRVDDRCHAYVHVEAGGLEVQEACVETAQSFHEMSPLF